jgi:hypothetical protein
MAASTSSIAAATACKFTGNSLFNLPINLQLKLIKLRSSLRFLDTAAADRTGIGSGGWVPEARVGN